MKTYGYLVAVECEEDDQLEAETILHAILYNCNVHDIKVVVDVECLGEISVEQSEQEKNDT